MWNEIEPNGASGNASLLKSLSVLIETEDDEICAEVEENAEIERDRIGGDEIDENVPADSKTVLDSGEGALSGNEKNINNGNDDDDGTSENSPGNEQSEENVEKNEGNGSQPQSLGAIRNEQSSPNPINSNETEKKMNIVKIKIPPIWAPVDQRTNSALIYLYFRSVRKKIRSYSK